MLFRPIERAYAETIRRMAFTNPFEIAAQAALRSELAGISLGLTEAEQDRQPLAIPDDPAIDLVIRRTEALLGELQRRADTQAIEPRELNMLEDLILVALYFRHFAALEPLAWLKAKPPRAEGYQAFARELARWRKWPVKLTPYFDQPEHVFSINFQLRLAVELLKTLLAGRSKPIVRLRASIWHSIFPRELRLYGILLYQRMQEVTTLILGPSGTGKELVATTIGLARFVPFDAQRERFTESFAGAFHPLNLSAMPRELIESEMFGHVAGSFTGAAKDREGWFEKCRRGHTVFLDELGELDESVQVRLLRVLQNREFYRVGDAEPRRFDGRVIAATNRDLSALIASGRFREDLYFRLCSDIVRTPSLREQLDDAPEELGSLIANAANRCLGQAARPEFVESLCQATLDWIERSPAMGLAYEWPGNFRELEQCVRSVMVRGEYHPPIRQPAAAASKAESPRAATAVDRLAAEVRAGSLSFDDLLIRYCSLIQARTGNVAETARRLKKHRLTVQGRIDPTWVEKFRGGS